MKKIKVCLVIPSLEPGGMERVMSELAAQFAKNENLDVHLVLYGPSREIFYPLPGNITIHIPGWIFNSKKRRQHGIKTLSFLRKKITSLKPDTVLSFGERWNNMVLLSLLGTGIKIYIADRSQPMKNLGKVHNSLRRWLYPRAEGLILQTVAAEKIYSSHWPTLKIKVIGNPIKQIPAEKVQQAKRENNVLMVSRLIEGKHHDRLIKIFASVNMPGWKLVLVGQPFPGQYMMDNLQELAKKLGVNDRVVFTGAQQNVDDYYLKAKIFAFTSSSEGFPNVVGEAMAAGLPVISYDCFTGPAEMINNGTNGFLISLFDDTMFEICLKKLMSDEALRSLYGQQATDDIQQFAPEKISTFFLKFITSHLS